MIKLGKGIVKFRVPILIFAILLLIPSAFGYVRTRVNYDILSYLPQNIDTMKGQDILMSEFGTGANSFLIVKDMPDKEVADMVSRMEEIPHVKDVIWYGTVADISIPREILPEKAYRFFNNREEGSQLIAVLYDNTMASDEVMGALEQIDSVADKQCRVSGMASVIRDIKLLSEKETPIYVVLAVILSLAVLVLTMDSALAPILFLLSIGMAVIYNLGTNIFAGEISYVTQALAAVLQLGVTMDYSIFLWHSYEEQLIRFEGDKNRAMAHAISNTISSVVGSSTTTVAGFVALCFMSFTLGLDLGIVMAKGVVFGVIGCVTILPAMILIFDRAVQKTRHKVILPDPGGIADWITRHYIIWICLFLVILGPAIYGYTHTDVYYDLAGSLPDSLASRQANEQLQKQYDMGATHIVLVRSDMGQKSNADMVAEINRINGVKQAVSLDSALGIVPESVVPDKLRTLLKGENYQMVIVANEYAIASDDVNSQIDQIQDVAKRYDPNAMVIGEASCTKDLIEITNTDFARVSTVSIGAIFIIILVVFKSISLPIILVAVIEFAIFINMGIPAYTGTVLPFIASIVIGTIQLGATVDYAILMTNKYKKNRSRGMEKQDAVGKALRSSIQSIMVSAFAFFAATFGVGMFSNIDMISSLCILMARGAIISMFVVIFVLPSMFMIFDRLIIHTSIGFKNRI